MVGFAPIDVNPSVYIKLASAGLGGCIADVITFPLDTAKVRLQIQGESTGSSQKANSKRPKSANFRYRGVFGTIWTIVRQEGPRGLYNGLVPGLQRQMCFASVRIGLYDSVKAFYAGAQKVDYGGVNILTRICAGITTGAFAVTCAQPTDVVKIRMQAQGNAELTGAPKRYSGAMNAYQTIAKEEGVRGLWKGTMPNIARNSVVNASEVVAYDLIKEAILRRRWMNDEFPCHFVSAFGAGFVTTCVATPVDVVKTRYMNSGMGRYRGAMDCATQMFRKEGPFAFYKGFTPQFLRLGAWNIVMFVSFEQLKRGMVILSTQKS
ncbi:dicarboxylate carrier UCP2-like isoform X1 [Diadema antillarum]|uniref:dicarboxylate carrier UCP2-like isoform X1 n=1 Tax=Diadema antillarum TaxID=105358 RepID=UPI003A8979FF